ncbi:MAG: sugar ABC transporter ATP-binding protein [Chloroflexota bacterium]
MSSNPMLELRGISKRYGAVQALREVSVQIQQGQIHALVGENGAGKSTLGKVISGIVRPDKGQHLVDGEAVHYTSPRDALADGITTITQEIALTSKQTVLQNVLLGQERTQFGVLNRRAMLEKFAEVRDLTGFDLVPHVKVNTLRLADQKKVEVMQAIARNARLIIMDEPTAMLADDDTEIFLATVRRLKGMGYTIVYVSHFLEEVLSIADTVTIMRNGEIIRTGSTEQETPATLIEGMLGKSMSEMYPRKQFPADDAPVVLDVQGLSSEIFTDVNLQIKAGEIVGLAGLVGSGRSRLARTLFGAEIITGGTVHVHGEPVTLKTGADAIKAGIHLLPESRKEQGLLLKQTLRHNVTLPHMNMVTAFGGVIRNAQEKTSIEGLIRELNVQPPHLNNSASGLSGGNQQKLLFSKWLYKRPRVFIIDEPTRGVDVGAKQAIYELIVELAAQGMAILMVSSEIEEIMGLAHRVLVMRFGEIVAEERATGADPLNQKAIIQAAFGADETQSVR